MTVPVFAWVCVGIIIRHVCVCVCAFGGCVCVTQRYYRDTNTGRCVPTADHVADFAFEEVDLFGQDDEVRLACCVARTHSPCARSIARCSVLFRRRRTSSCVRLNAYLHPSIYPSIHPSIHPYIHTYNHVFVWQPRTCWPTVNNPTKICS